MYRGLFAFALLLMAGLLFVTAGSREARADTPPDCLETKQFPSKPGALQGWWDRRSEEQKQVLRALPCEQRYIAATCIFLYHPDLKACTNKGVAKFEANRKCMAEGHELMTPELAACEQNYISTAKPAF